jgi:hypothetical protein
MDLEKDGQKCVVRSTGESVSELLNYIEKNHVDLIENHLIIDFSEKININIKELMLFLDLSVNHKRNGTSFVIVAKGIDIDAISEEINIVPTVQEALDILEMDAIERDLGF